MISTLDRLLHELADFLQDFLITGFLVLACLAVVVVVYMALRDLWEEWRSAGEDERHPGPFGLRRGSRLREDFSRRHEVEVRTRWYSSGRWVPWE